MHVSIEPVDFIQLIGATDGRLGCVLSGWEGAATGVVAPVEGEGGMGVRMCGVGRWATKESVVCGRV